MLCQVASVVSPGLQSSTEAGRTPGWLKHVADKEVQVAGGKFLSLCASAQSYMSTFWHGRWLT